jgi:hypothetical protein
MGNSNTQDSPRLKLRGSRHLPLYSIVCASPRGPHPNGFFVPGVPKFSQLGLSRLWRHITSSTNLWLRWGLKQSYSPYWELFNDMLHVAYMWGNWIDSRLLVVRSQIANLTFDLFLGHNLCFRCPNGQCEPILYIYASIYFQWCKKILEVMGFDPCNHVLKVWESI